MAIKHRNYHDGGVQSLAFTMANGKKATVGVASPGEWDFGIAKAPEKIRVLIGELAINGILGVYFEINVGDPIVFQTMEGCSYLCEY